MTILAVLLVGSALAAKPIEKSPDWRSTVSIRMLVRTYVSGGLERADFAACDGTAITSYNHWPSLVSNARLWERVGWDRRLPVLKRPYRRAVRHDPDDADRMVREEDGPSDHDWVVIFGTSSWALPPCAVPTR
ncbi:MAG: hypothetical protein KC656_07925 [Myxococcales bacterium]|nr:hypothetical protein [Myxococcales bacterium]MCA9567755.1 hypothetical protein [Myxococcales bacterium]